MKKDNSTRARQFYHASCCLILLLFVTFPSPWFRKKNFQFIWKVHKFEMNGHVSKSRVWHVWRMYVVLKLVLRYKQTKKIIIMFWMNSWVVFFFYFRMLSISRTWKAWVAVARTFTRRFVAVTNTPHYIACMSCLQTLRKICWWMFSVG